MDERHERLVVIPTARAGRPSVRARVYESDAIVRFDARIPAPIARRLYELAHETGRSVTAVHADLLTRAFSTLDEGAMG